MRFVIICAARTGSSHLASSLGGHPEIFLNGNIFDARLERLYVFWPTADVSPSLIAELVELRRNDPEAFLDRVYSMSYGRPHVGFKIFEGENDAMLDRIVSDSAIRKIILYRRNILASFSSALLAKSTGQYGRLDGRPPLTSADVQKVRFNQAKFAKYHDRYSSFIERTVLKLEGVSQSYLFIHYEDINDPHMLANAAAFVGADPATPFSRELRFKIQLKQNPPDILSRFSNPRVVEKFLRERNLMEWLHEGGLDLGRRIKPAGVGSGEKPTVIGDVRLQSR